MNLGTVKMRELFVEKNRREAGEDRWILILNSLMIIGKIIAWRQKKQEAVCQIAYGIRTLPWQTVMAG